MEGDQYQEISNDDVLSLESKEISENNHDSDAVEEREDTVTSGNEEISPATGAILPILQKFIELSDKIKVLKDEHAVVYNEVKEIKKCSFVDPEISRALQLLTNELGTLEKQYLKEASERKQLYNEVIELKGNIRVYCRCRPLHQSEIANGYASVAEFDSTQENDLQIISSDSSKKHFKFDHVFKPEDNLDDMRRNEPGPDEESLASANQDRREESSASASPDRGEAKPINVAASSSISLRGLDDMRRNEPGPDEESLASASQDRREAKPINEESSASASPDRGEAKPINVAASSSISLRGLDDMRRNEPGPDEESLASASQDRREAKPINEESSASASPDRGEAKPINVAASSSISLRGLDDMRRNEPGPDEESLASASQDRREAKPINEESSASASPDRGEAKPINVAASSSISLRGLDDMRRNEPGPDEESLASASQDRREAKPINEESSASASPDRGEAKPINVAASSSISLRGLDDMRRNEPGPDEESLASASQDRREAKPINEESSASASPDRGEAKPINVAASSSISLRGLDEQNSAEDSQEEIARNIEKLRRGKAASDARKAAERKVRNEKINQDRRVQKRKADIEKKSNRLRGTPLG